MSLGGGKSSSSNKGSSTNTSNTNTNFSTSTTPTNPTWVTNGAQGLYSTAQGLAAANPQSYVAAPNSLLTQAGTNASALTTSPSVYQTAEGITSNAFGRPAAQSDAVQASPFIAQYMSPYTDDVVNAALAAFDNQAGQTKAQQDLTLAQSGALGGSGAWIDKALTNGQLALSRGQLQGGLLNQGFSTALGAAQNDANNAQSANNLNAQLKQQNRQMILNAANQLGNLATQQNQNANQNIATQDAAGNALQTIAQQQASAPLDLQSWLGKYFSGLPLNLFSGQDQTGTQTQNGTESGTTKGSSTGYNFGFKI